MDTENTDEETASSAQPTREEIETAYTRVREVQESTQAYTIQQLLGLCEQQTETLQTAPPTAEAILAAAQEYHTLLQISASLPPAEQSFFQEHLERYGLTFKQKIEENPALEALGLDSLYELGQRTPQPSQARGRSGERNSPAPRELSPPRLQDTAYEQGRHFLQEGITSCYEAREQLKQGVINLSTITRTAGAYGLDAVAFTYRTLDTLSQGSVSWACEQMDDAAHWVGTQTRRGEG